MARVLRGQRVLITGASSGIGRALTEQAAWAGARVVAAARSAETLEELAASLNAQGGALVAVAADITSEPDRRRLMETAVARLGGLDVLVNNAGVAASGHFADCSEEILRQVMEVNFFAPAELIRRAIPVLSRGDRPAVVNVASMCGRRGMPAWPEYSASKFALCGLTEALRAELTRYNIDVLLMVPGLTRSGLNQHLLRDGAKFKTDLKWSMKPEEVAAAIWKAMARNRTESVIGWEARWMLRFNRFLPRLLDRLLARRVRQLWSN
jgi:short-subunit dehydrogenase